MDTSVIITIIICATVIALCAIGTYGKGGKK